MTNLNKTCKYTSCGRTRYSQDVCIKHYSAEKKIIEFSKSMHPASLAKRNKTT